MRHILFLTAATALAVSASHASAGNLLINGSFELPGNFSGFGGRDIILQNGLTGQAMVDGLAAIPGWYYNGAGYPIYEGDADGIAPADGSYYISMGHDGSSGEAFSQTVKGLTAGTTYTLTYDVAEQQGTDPTQDVQVSVLSSLGDVNLSVDNLNIGYGFKPGLSLSFVSDGSDLTVTFTDISSAYYANTAVDNFCLSADGSCAPTARGVPEPASWAVMAIGLGVIGAGLRRRAIVGRGA